MSTLTLSLNLPESLYRRLENRAKQTSRSVEEESLDMLATTLLDDDRLSEDLETTLAAMHAFDEASLQRAAQVRLPIATSERLEELHIKRQREGLTEAEDLQRSQLIEEYERHMLIRAQAAALLQQRELKPAN